jgi:hypothetical protein
MAEDYDIVRLGSSRENGMRMAMKINTPKGEIDHYLAMLNQEITRTAPDFEKIKAECFELLCRLPLPIWIFDRGFVLRSRRNFNGEVFQSASEISYNPRVDKVSLGRFNLGGEAAFYCSVPLSTSGTQGYASSICEGGKELFDTESAESRYDFTVGKWIVVRPINVVVLTFYGPAIQVCEDAGRINSKFSGDLSEALSAEDYTKWRSFQDFFSERAARKYDSTKSYLLMTAFRHALQQRYGGQLGILYSSSMTENQGMNLVLSREVIDGGSLVLEGANMVRCERNPSKYKKYTTYPCSNYATADSQRFAFTCIW